MTFGLRLLLSLLFLSLLPPGYVPDFICTSDLRSEMGPAQPLWGLKDDSEPLLGPGPGHGVRDEPLPIPGNALGLPAPRY